MKKTQVGAKNYAREHNVVRLRLDAGFFFERAVRSLDRHRYDKALKYFRLAVEKEPDNPVNLCNLAGILSEMGYFEESNEVLRRILEHADPDLSECWFYMANNAANMDDFDKAEEHLIHYLEEEPGGEFAQEAEEMLDMLAYELGRQPRRPEHKPKKEWLRRHEEARIQLESGHFLQATDTLEKLVAEYPDFSAARNNLALAYYYTGELDKAKSVIGEVLTEDPSNLHALCNLAVLAQHNGDTHEREQLVAMLKKWLPYQTEHIYKLGTTMGILGEHEVAYQLFRRLLKLEKDLKASLYHYVAAAAFNTKRYIEARKYWRMAKELDPQSKAPSFFLNQIDSWQGVPPTHLPMVSYHYQLPFEEQFSQLGQQVDQIPEQIKENPLIRSSFFWALNHGDFDTKVQVIQVLEWIGDQETEEVLKNFLMRKEEEDELKRMTLYVLKRIGASVPFRAILEGREVTIHPRDLSQEMPSWLENWERVLECCLAGMRGQYESAHMNDAQVIWTDFLRQNHPSLPEIRKVEGWAAALEYVVAKLHGLSLTQKSVARKHEVSSSTVGRHVRLLEQAYNAKGNSQFSWRSP
ncbi:tetratricopeptide repeat protein [Marininema halotolerans]|uniref:Tetratricopeptide repeat-containing protein n=1 Tax=Marininema halotolerans TaxID=1155944 RepID=A0A1I6NX74_9BACL|nr:tetratricopeptide repeat protein [Marininema halotolerans]SFS32438.1 Tetratricopeptide repeat-containing protein [Marininema halotolerans]